jgi:hypothetical protein
MHEGLNELKFETLPRGICEAEGIEPFGVDEYRGLTIPVFTTNSNRFIPDFGFGFLLDKLYRSSPLLAIVL